MVTLTFMTMLLLYSIFTQNRYCDDIPPALLYLSANLSFLHCCFLQTLRSRP